jgi:chemotaxis protein MotB
MRINAMNNPARRRPARRWAGLLGAAALATAAVLGGCSGRTNELMETTRAYQDRNVVLTQENESLQAANASLQASVENRDRMIAQMRADMQQFAGSNADLLARMQTMDESLRNMKFGQLDPTTDAALQALAAQYPDLIMYDSDRGMIRFKSDLTFGSGSADVTAQGKQSLQALARILQAPEAMNYDIRVVGHTDSQRISSVTGQKHPTNMHLSAHRSISVFNELQGMGVAAQRIEVAGRGEYMPAVANSGNGNTPENRRVEIFVVRSMRPAGVSPPAAPAPAPTAQGDDIVK